MVGGESEGVIVIPSKNSDRYKDKELKAAGLALAATYFLKDEDVGSELVEDTIGDLKYPRHYKHDVKKTLPLMSRPIIILKRGRIETPARGFVPSEPEIEEEVSPYTNGIIEANEDW